MNAYILIILVLAGYFIVLITGYRAGFWRRHGVSLMGPVVLVRTRLGSGLAERLASPARLWRAYGVLSMAVLAASSATVTLILLWQSVSALAPAHPYEEPVELRLSQEGLLPAVTAAFLALGLAVATAVHELGHAAMAAAWRIRLAAVGVLILAIPIGAFVEPDDKDLALAPRKARAGLYAAGPASNMLVALAVLALFAGLLAPSARPVSDGPVVVSVTAGSPADLFGISLWSSIVSVNDMAIAGVQQLEELWFSVPGEPVELKVLYRHRVSSVTIPGGVVVTDVLEGPAWNAGIKPGMIISSLNGTVIHDLGTLRSVVENSTHEAPVEISVLSYREDPGTGIGWFFEEPSIRTINLTSKWL